MRHVDESRRRLVGGVALGAVLFAIARAPLERAFATELQPVGADDPVAKAVNYVADARQAAAAKPGSTCANCALYQGAAGSAQGGCTLFAGKAVRSTGWCISWTVKK